MNHDLFADAPQTALERIDDGVVLLRAFASDASSHLLRAIEEIAARAPFRRMITPGGFRMSVAMTNCGEAGWVTDRKGYRYVEADPDTGERWPPMPQVFATLAHDAATAAGFAGFQPDACLINRYEAGAHMSLHQDKDERDFTQPIVSASLGAPATFLFGGSHRSDRTQRIGLRDGDVVVWGGPARLRFHGVAPLRIEAGGCRINLTFRRAR